MSADGLSVARHPSVGVSPAPGAPAEGAMSSADQILDGLAEGFFALDADWRFVAFNRAAEEICLMRREDVIGKTLWEVSPTVVGTEFERRYRLVMKTRERQAFEASPTRLRDRFHEIRAFPLGEGIGVAFKDATEQREILQRLRQRENELARVQAIGLIGGMRVDIGDAFKSYRSPEYLRVHGLPPESAIETHEDWVARLHPDDRSRAVEHFFAALAGEAHEYKSEYRIVRPSDGAIRWIRAVAEIERDKDGIAVALVGAHIDITEQKRAEQEALESEDRLRAIADALPVLISYVDKDQVFQFVNRAYEIWFDRPRSEIVGRTVAAVMTPDMYAARRANLERALGGEKVSYEADFPRAGGVAVTEVVHVPHRDASGEVLGVHVVVTDVTQRKLAERKIAESEARFRAIANSAPVPIWVTAPDGTREFANQAYLDFLGLPFERAVLFDWRKALHPDDLPRILEEQRVKEASRLPFALEARYRRADSQWRWLRSESQPKWGPEGDPVGFIGVAHDVTEDRNAQEELTRINETLEKRVAERTAQLAASEALVRTFFQHSPECHAVLVEDGTSFSYQEVNPATLRLYGMTRDQVIGRKTEEVFGPEAGAEISRHLEACIRNGGTYHYERAQSDATVEAVATAVPSRDGEPRRVVVSARDVTERRRLHEQLRQSQKMEALGQLTGGVAHDFNNLLTLMLGGLDTIDRQMAQMADSPAKARIERAKDMALQGVQRARALTGRLLAFSRRQALAPQAVDANALVGGICDLLQRTLGEQIALTTLPADALWHAFVDPNQLENALINLALNARDAMPRGGRLIIETANRRLTETDVAGLPEPVEPGDYVMIAVMDTGVGMDEDTRKRAFDPFFTTKDIGKGTGLGLSQVYGFSRQSGGHVQIESEPGSGATVKIYLPRVASANAGPGERTRLELGSAGGRESVLVVEDDDAVRAYTTGALRDLGYRVAEASRGKAALEVLNHAPHLDLLLTDVVMPGPLNGRELADLAVRRRPGLRVLYMTGYSRDAIIRHGRLDPGVHVLGKPFSLEELAEKVRERLDASE